MPASVQFPDFDVTEAHEPAVILKRDVAAELGREVRHQAEFAARDKLPALRARKIDVDDFFTIQPVLDFPAANDDKRVIPFARRPDRVLVGSDHVVKGPGTVQAVILVRVGIIEQLIFRPRFVRTRSIETDPVNDPAVRTPAYFPADSQFKVAELSDGYQVAGVTGRRQLAVGDDPAGAGLFVPESSPAIEGRAVEQELPAARSFCRRNRIEPFGGTEPAKQSQDGYCAEAVVHSEPSLWPVLEDQLGRDGNACNSAPDRSSEGSGEHELKDVDAQIVSRSLLL
jgi:hypothetical protein